MSIDALQSLGNSAQTKASDHLLNIPGEHNNKNYERLIGLYHGCESYENHILHYGDSRMGPFYGNILEQNDAISLHPRKLGMITEIEDLSINGIIIDNVHVNVLYIMAFDMPGMIKWRKLNSQTSRDGCPFCEKGHDDLYTNPHELAPLYEMETLVMKGNAYEQERARLIKMKTNKIKAVSEITKKQTITVTNAMIERYCFINAIFKTEL